MALSDYLTNKEWDACYYASLGQHRSENFGESMKKTIAKLIEKGYKFRGLTDDLKRIEQVPSNNANKILIFFGKTEGIDIHDILNNGRIFLKEHCPELVDESDEEWVLAINAFKPIKTIG
jgi:hypothetical protein